MALFTLDCWELFCIERNYFLRAKNSLFRRVETGIFDRKFLDFFQSLILADENNQTISYLI